MKLVRDNISQYVFNLRGEHLNVRIADQSEMLDLFKRKLMEESAEVMQADTQDHIAEELADVLEVVEGLWSITDLKIR